MAIDFLNLENLRIKGNSGLCKEICNTNYIFFDLVKVFTKVHIQNQIFKFLKNLSSCIILDWKNCKSIFLLQSCFIVI
jgi:hypothetical protein